MNTRTLHQAALAALLLALAPAVHAELIMVDLGGTSYTGTNSPAHAEGTVSPAETVWSKLSNPLVDTYVNLSIGSVEVHWGRNWTAGGEGVTWRRPGVNRSSTVSSGVFDTDLTRDAVVSYTPDSAALRDPAGLMVTGLAAGQYYVYVVVHYAGNVDTAFNVRATAAPKTGVGSNKDTTVISDIYTFAVQGVTLPGTTTDQWLLNNNYARFTVDVTGVNDAIYAFSDRDQRTTGNATIAALQIVPTGWPPTGTVVVIR